jgi:hypothetical protein
LSKSSVIVPRRRHDANPHGWLAVSADFLSEDAEACLKMSMASCSRDECYRFDEAEKVCSPS